MRHAPQSPDLFSVHTDNTGSFLANQAKKQIIL
jgi:hypothetical protein